MMEKLQMEIAWRMPRWLVYWCANRLVAEATSGRYSSTIVPELTAMEALKRWNEPDDLNWQMRLRKKLLIGRSSIWNAWVRDWTGWLEIRFPKKEAPHV
jgi:hypothetical protein